MCSPLIGDCVSCLTLTVSRPFFAVEVLAHVVLGGDRGGGYFITCALTSSLHLSECGIQARAAALSLDWTGLCCSVDSQRLLKLWRLLQSLGEERPVKTLFDLVALTAQEQTTVWCVSNAEVASLTRSFFVASLTDRPAVGNSIFGPSNSRGLMPNLDDVCFFRHGSSHWSSQCHSKYENVRAQVSANSGSTGSKPRGFKR